MLDPALALCVSLAGALLFGTAAAHKLRDPRLFAATLAEYRLLPHPLVWPAALAIIALECALTFGFCWPATRAASGAAAAALLLIYAAGIGANLARGRRDLDCGCSGRPQPIGAWLLARNGLLAVALASLTLPVAPRSLAAADIASACAALLVATLLYLSANLLLGRAPPRHAYSPESP